MELIRRQKAATSSSLPTQKLIGNSFSGLPEANMECSSRVYTSPSFNRHICNNIVNIADRVANEFRTENGFHDDVNDAFSFSDDRKTTETGDGDEDKVNININNMNINTNMNFHTDLDEVEREFEFPVICGDSNLNQDQSDHDELVYDDQISPRYPLFDRSLLSEVDVNLSNGVDTPKTDQSKRSPTFSTRSSLRKLLSEERDTASTSSSEADDLGGITPGTYCVWKPKKEPRGKHKKSNSISIGNTSNRWKVPDLLKRSYSDDNYTIGKDSRVLLFVPPVSPNQKNNEKANKIEKPARISSPVGGGVPSPEKNLKNNEKVNRTEKPARISFPVGGGVPSPEKKTPAYKTKIGNIRLPPFLPYRPDQEVAAFGNFSVSNKHIYRY